MRFLLLFLLCIFLGACSGNRVEELNASTKSIKNDIADLRSLQAQHSSAINEIRSELRTLSGKIEEIQHVASGKTEELEQTLSKLKSRVPPPAGVPEELLNEDDERIASIPGEAADTYKKALSLLRTGDFEACKTTLTSFVEANPGTAFTDNALFWLGITYDKLGQYDKAIGSFSEVFQKYPAEDRVSPSLYYLAESLVKLGSKEDAVLTLQKLIDEHGDSSYAARGKARLKELGAGSGRRK